MRRRHSPESMSRMRKNHLREHIAAIAEMSCLTHEYKEKEREEEVKRLESIKHWGGRELPRSSTPKKVPDQPKVRTNFVERNKENITEQSAYVRALRLESKRHELLSPHNENSGRIPEYLQRIKIELAQEAERRALEEAAKSYPPGRRLMSEMNRLHILQKLESQHKKLIQTLKSFPLLLDTPRQIRQKSEVEDQLRDIEASHRYYDNPKVFTWCLDAQCPTCMQIDSHFFRDSSSLQQRTRHGAAQQRAGDEDWDHMAQAAGIQSSSPRRGRSPVCEAGGAGMDVRSSYAGPFLLPKKRRNVDGDVYASPTKRRNILPLERQSRDLHIGGPSAVWGNCKTRSSCGRTS